MLFSMAPLFQLLDWVGGMLNRASREHMPRWRYTYIRQSLNVVAAEARLMLVKYARVWLHQHPDHPYKERLAPQAEKTSDQALRTQTKRLKPPVRHRFTVTFKPPNLATPARFSFAPRAAETIFASPKAVAGLWRRFDALTALAVETPDQSARRIARLARAIAAHDARCAFEERARDGAARADQARTDTANNDTTSDDSTDDDMPYTREEWIARWLRLGLNPDQAEADYHAQCALWRKERRRDTS